MILKLNNKDSNFYNYMGKIFGSRVIERQINDRIYDDNNKEWYIYIKEEKVLAFVSVNDSNIIKNVYSSKDEYLKEIFKQLLKDIKVFPSRVSNIYKDIYLDSGLKVTDEENFKNFITIWS